MSAFQTLLMKTASWAARILPAPVKRWLYRIPALARALRGTLNAVAPEGLTEVAIAAGAARGMRMALDLKAEKDYWLGTYEPDLQAAARALIRPGMVIYDVGANIGFISLMAAALSGESGRIFAFEALPKNVERLRTSIALNGLSDRVTAIHAAVAERSGKARFLAHASGAMGKTADSAGRDEDYEGEIIVPAIALDDFVYEQGNAAPQLVKMDIEGGEGPALRGMHRLLDEERPVLMIELHGQEAARLAWDCLTGHAYSIRQMAKGMPEIPSFESLDWKAYVVALPG